MKQTVQRIVAVVTLASALAVIVAPSMCSWVPAWMRWYLGCPECDGSEAGNIAAGGGCSGASELRLPAGFEIEGGGRGTFPVGMIARR